MPDVNKPHYPRIFVGLEKPGQSSVLAIDLLNDRPGGFRDVPRVEIVGGARGGDGATARAHLSYAPGVSATLTRIEVTNGGARYSSAAPPIVRVIRGARDSLTAPAVRAFVILRPTNLTEITPWVQEETLRIQETMGRTINTCSFEMRDLPGSPIPIDLDEFGAADIQIVEASVPYDPEQTDINAVVSSIQDDWNKRIFAGIIASTEENVEGLYRHMSVSAQDYTVLLSKVYIPQYRYTSDQFPTDKSMIQHFFANSFRAPNEYSEITVANLHSQSVLELTGFDVDTFVEEGVEVPSMDVNRMELSQAIDQLAGNAGYEWYVDYYQRLHYYLVSDSQASLVDLSDMESSSTFATYSDFSRSNDSVGTANVFEIIGGEQKAGLRDNRETMPVGDGVRHEFGLDRQWIAAADEEQIVVRLSPPNPTTPYDFDSWTRLSVAPEGTSGADEADVVWNGSQRLLIFSEASTPGVGVRIYVQGSYTYRLTRHVELPDSYERLGRWFWEKIIDEEIRSEEQADLRIKREIAEKQFGVEQIGCKITYPRQYDSTDSVGSTSVGLSRSLLDYAANPTEYDSTRPPTRYDWRTPLKIGDFVYFEKHYMGADGQPAELVADNFLVERLDTEFLGGSARAYAVTLRVPFLAEQQLRVIGGVSNA